MFKIDFDTEYAGFYIKVIAIGKTATRIINKICKNSYFNVEFLDASSPEIAKKDLSKTDLVILVIDCFDLMELTLANEIASKANSDGALTILIIKANLAPETSSQNLIFDRLRKAMESHFDSIFFVPNINKSIAQKGYTITQEKQKFVKQLFLVTKTILELFTNVGLMKLGFMDLKILFSKKGVAKIGIGKSNNYKEAVLIALKDFNRSIPSDILLKDAKHALIHITGCKNFSFQDYEVIIGMIHEELDEEVDLYHDLVINKKFDKEVKVVVLAAGFNLFNN